MENNKKLNNFQFPKVAVLVLTWNNYIDTSKCIESLHLLDYPNYEIVVVDNGSTDGSIQKIKKDFPSCTYILNGDNFYFSEGNNKGIREILNDEAVELIFLLNNDTIVTNKKTLCRLVEFLKNNDKKGIVSARPVYPDGSNQVDLSSLKFPSILSFILVNSFVGRIYAKIKFLPPPNRFTSQSLVCVDWVPIGVSLIKRDIFEKCSFDGENFPMEFSDVDFCKQATAEGSWKIYLMNDLSIIHSHSFPNTAEKLERNFLRAKYAEIRYIRKYFSRSYGIVYKTLVFLNSLFYIILLPFAFILFIKQRRKIYLKWKNHLFLTFKIWWM